MADTEKHEKKKKTKETKPGIVYLSRLPPFMKPSKVRYIFSQFGEVGRLFLQPEGLKMILNFFNSFTCWKTCFEICGNFVFLDESVRKKRKKFGGSGRKAFTEGWVEFKDKKIAKKVASSLNNTNIGKWNYVVWLLHCAIMRYLWLCLLLMIRWKEEELLSWWYLEHQISTTVLVGTTRWTDW